MTVPTCEAGRVAPRVSSRRFVGREPQLAELLRVLDEAREGRAWVALVAGESGVGKTRLVDELAARARERGARVLSGDCVELADGELPYAPLIGALRPLIRSGDPALDAVRAELDRPRGEAGAPPQGRFFELLLDALHRLADEAPPLVLVLEDLHWADRSTRDFLAFAARNLCRDHVLLVATYRTDELHRRHPLRPLLPEIERLDRTTRATLERLTREELADLLADVLGAPPEPALVDRLFERSDGNPLFAEELLAAGLDGRGELPPTLRDALLVRVEPLDEATQALLRVVGAAGRGDEALLEEVSGLAPVAVRAALREAIAHHVLVPDDDGRIAFRHALLREAIHDELLPGEAVELHLALARALERRADAGADDLDTVTAIAHHFAVAGEQPEALGAAVRAADAAERIHAPAEAAAQLERALSLWPHVPDARGRAGLDHPRLLERLATASRQLGDDDRARQATESALAEVDARTDPQRAARLLQAHGTAVWHLGRGEEAMASYERGLELLAADPAPSGERAHLLSARAKTLMVWGRYSEAAEVCEATLREARAVGSRVAQASALNTLGVAQAGLGDVEGGITSLEESIAMERLDGRVEGIERGFANLADVLLIAGRTREALETTRAGLAELDRLGTRANWSALQLAEILTALGAWDEAEEIVGAERAPRHLGVHATFFHLIASDLALGRGDTAKAIEHLGRARGYASRALDPQWHAPLAALTAEALRRERRFAEAEEALVDGFARLGRIAGLQDHARVQRLAAAGVALHADVAQRARDLGDADAEAAALAHAEDALERARALAGTPGSGPWLAVAEAEATRAIGDPTPSAWALAAAAWDAMERPYLAAIARWREAEAHAQLGDRAAAEAAARAARAVAAAVGSSWLADELLGLARRARLRLEDAARPRAAAGMGAGDGAAPGDAGDPDAGAAGPRAAIDALGLTPREQEVLALLADGRTNREIGETLFMAEKTASVHVSRILAKLDVRTRTEAAAVAYRLGLVVGESAR